MWSPQQREIKLFQCYDGTLYTAGIRQLQWQNKTFEVTDLQLIAKHKRKYYNRLETQRTIGRLVDAGIAVPDVEKAAGLYRDWLGADVSAPRCLPEHGLIVATVSLVNTQIELLQPMGGRSPVGEFLERYPEGGLHHLCYQVDDLAAARNHLRTQGCHVLGDGEPQIGWHGKPMLFIADELCGVRVLLEEA